MEEFKIDLIIPYYVDEESGEKVFDWEGLAETLEMEIRDQTDEVVYIEITED